MSVDETNLSDNHGNKYTYIKSVPNGGNDGSCRRVRQRRVRPWKDECYKFAQETTLHGLKYISLKDTFVLRRIFWFVLTCFCLGVMSYQIIDRIIYYYKSPITVNVKVNYNRSLLFPSVTVCNQNAFKSSAAAAHNWYRLIETMYNGSSSSLDTSQLEQFNISKLRLSDLFINAGHTKEDLIVGCIWAGGTCTHEDFQPILTDHGLCYTFKPRNIEQDIVVRSTGSDQGLKLLVNVEQYEYMPGPNDAAGVKLLTYEESDIPRIKELGISIPTDIHAFVGLQLLVVRNLHVPEGECQRMDLKYSRQYSMDACIIECLNEIAEKRCGCRNYFIPDTTASGDECTIEEYYYCYEHYYELVRETLQEQCKCPTACDYYLYDPAVSYASTSEYAAESKLTSVSTDILQQKVLNAREVAHRMEKRKFNLFRDLILNLEYSFDDVSGVFQQITRKIALHRKLIDARYTEDKKAWDRKQYLFRYQIYNIEKNFIRARDAMEERTLSNLCVGFYEFVFMIETNLRHLEYTSGLDNTTRSQIYLRTHDSIQSQIETAERAYANVTQLYDSYKNGTPIFKYKYWNTPRKNNIHIVPKQLLADSLKHNYYARRYAPRLKLDIKNITLNLKQYKLLLKDVHLTGNLNLVNMKSISSMYIDSCEDFYHSKSVFYAECVERPQRKVKQSYDQFNQFTSSYIGTVEFLIGHLNNLENSLINISTKEVTKIQRFIYDLNSYLGDNSTVTKDYLADVVLSNDMLSQLSRFETIFQEIRNRGQNIYDGWTDLMSRTSDIWKAIVEDDRMTHYYRYKNYSSFLVNFTDFSTNTNLEIIATRNVNDLRAAIGDTEKKFGHHFEALKSNLVRFKSSLKIDEHFLKDNFLQIDVFYRQLSYEEIEQQVAYDIFALLCDIGGSMGLFIGASVMTIFEILDFGLNMSAEKIVRKKRFRTRQK